MVERVGADLGPRMLLKGKRALVTGAGGRLGRAITAVLVREGAAVAAVDLNQASVEAAVRDHPPERVRALTADVSDKDQVDKAVSAAESALGPVDVLVNSHGIFPNCALLDVTVEEWDRVFVVNTRGTMLTCQALGRRWVERGTHGAIVNISSGAASSARLGGGHYAGSKAAVNLLTHALAIELGPKGIRVNAIEPGLILDEVVDEKNWDGQHPYVRLSVQGTPLGRTGRPEDIAETAAFLASDRSAWTTGAILAVTGGSHCGRTQMPITRGGLVATGESQRGDA